ncbi:ArdC family protein [Pseudomonas aeruginosa]|uniref:ArdC family protein n=1 Tax=Pseudomonas aeruginosa TaxID=287 RepID=UPI003D9C80D0
MATAAKSSTTTKPRARRARGPKIDRAEIQAKALQNALADRSAANYETIVDEFMQRGIPPEEITPRVNIFTYHAWRALGRQVRKGEKGVKILSMAPITRRADDNDAQADQGEGKPARMRPVPAVVFHISQTDPIEPAPAQA